MTRTLTLLALLAAGSGLLGCRGFDTPRSMRGSERPDRADLPIEEQERRARARYGLHEDDFRVGPRTYTDRVSPTGIGR
jgi:hypothetical protein